MHVARETLYDEVWSEPMTTVAERYGVSSSFMARVCKNLKVPRPPRGYWARRQAGKKVPSRPALPAPRRGDELVWSRGGDDRYGCHVQRARPKAPEIPATGRAPKPRRRRTEHPLVAENRPHFHDYRELRCGYLRPNKRIVLDVFTSVAAIDAAFKLANGLFWALEERGHQVAIAPRDQRLYRAQLDLERESGRRILGWEDWSPQRPTIIYIGTVAFGLTIYELPDSVDGPQPSPVAPPARASPFDQIELTPRNRARIERIIAELAAKRRSGEVQPAPQPPKPPKPSPLLAVRTYSPYPDTDWRKQWIESKTGEMHGQVGDIVQTLEQAAPTLVTLVEQAEVRAIEAARQLDLQRQEWRREEERRAQEEALRRRAQAEKDSRQQLLSIVEHWVYANQAEAFLAQVGDAANDMGDAERAEVMRRLEQARRLLGGTDALRWFLKWKPSESR